MSSQNKKKQTEQHGIGPIIGTLIIVILLITTAIYLWSEHLNTLSQLQQENNDLTSTSTTITIFNTSTNPADIEADLKATPPIQNPGF